MCPGVSGGVSEGDYSCLAVSRGGNECLPSSVRAAGRGQQRVRPPQRMTLTPALRHCQSALSDVNCSVRSQ